MLLVVYNYTTSPDDSQVINDDDRSFYDQLTDDNTVSSLSTTGKQPLVKTLSKHFHLMFLDDDNTEAWRSHLVNYLYR